MLILKFFLTLLSLLIGISSADANLMEEDDSTPAIVEHIGNIQSKTVEFAAVVGKWDGDVMDALSIEDASDSVIQAIQDGTKEATDLPKKMTTRQAVKIRTATKKLLKDIESSMGTITGKKLQFEDAGLTSMMVGRIEDTKAEAEGLIAAIINKLPLGKGIARRLGAKISAAFDGALAQFPQEAAPEAAI